MQAPFNTIMLSVTCFGLGVSPKIISSQIVDIDKQFFTNYIEPMFLNIGQTGNQAVRQH